MKSRNCVTKQNAFEPAASPMGKPTKDLSSKRNKRSLIPARSQYQGHPKMHTPDKNENHWPDKYGPSFFAHSGPSIDRVPSPTISDMEISSLSSRVPKSTASSQPGVHRDSVVTKYIDRFRYGEPQSREERQLMSSEFEEERVPLWWMSSSSLPPSSTPTKTPQIDDQAIFSPARRPLDDDFNSSPCRADYSMNAYIPSDTSQNEFEDTEILHLQERDSRFLQRCDSILSSGSIPVSSEGVGCSARSSPVNINETLQRLVANTSIKPTPTMATLDSAPAVRIQQYTVTSRMAPPARPEEDILTQWRLRRKMKQASERSQSQQNSTICTPTFRALGPSLQFTPVIGHPYKQQPRVQHPEPSQEAFPEHKEAHERHPSTPAPLLSAASQPQSLAHVPAHMHLLCDILPCPTQSAHASTFQGNPHEPERSVNKESKVSGNLEQSYMDEPPHRHIPSPTPAHSRHTDLGFPFRPADGGHPSMPREDSSPSRPLEGSRPSRFTQVKVDEPSKPKEENSLFRHMEEGSQSRPVAGHHRDPAMKIETAKKEKKQVKQVGESEKTDRIIRKQKKLTRCTGCSEHADRPSATSSVHQKLPKKSKTRAHPQQQERLKDTGSRAPPSPVHHASRQVVSEVMFPPEDSSPQDAAVTSPPAHPQSSIPPCNAHASLEVMTQLLQEAEDEKEFEDDPLLRVLRTQRKWVKEQIRSNPLYLSLPVKWTSDCTIFWIRKMIPQLDAVTHDSF
ncbi:proline and serine-rich protein 3 isoform X2 [Festucalex cinctus]